MSNKYDVSQIEQLSGFQHIQQRPGMYIGSTDSPINLLFEALDNSLDEALAGYASIIGVFIDTKNKTMSVLDNGRGIPCNPNLPLEKDPPVLISTKLFTSGKFRKENDDSAYKIAVGLHGIGLCAVVALSEYVKIEIYRDDYHVVYNFQGEKVDRVFDKIKKGDKVPFSTKIEIKPSEKFFDNLNVDLKIIEERIRLAVANHSDMKIIFRVDNKDVVVRGSRDDLLKDYLSKNITDWFTIQEKNKKTGENYTLLFGWDSENYSPPKILSSVNLVRTDSGIHLNKMLNAFRNVFSTFAKKYGKSFNKDDCLQGLRVYLGLEIITTSFEAQVKTTLEKNSDISIMNDIEDEIKKTLNSNEDVLSELLDRFHNYRQSLRSKKVLKSNSSRGRSITKFTKLRDCSDPGGELIIGEGDSAIGGIAEYRDSKRHALLPLRGVIPNVLTTDPKVLMKNEEMSELMIALGTGIEPNFDISKLRYKKIIIATDSDPAGYWIASLLIILFAKLTPEIIKNGHLFLCRTPLYAIKEKGDFIPLWTKEEIEKAKNENKRVKRFKGLGEFQPEDIKVFTLDEKTRILIKVTWPENEKDVDKLFELFEKSNKKRELVLGEWSFD